MNAREPISIQFLGDISFNDDYIDVLASGKDPFRQIRSTLIKSDLVVGNMECLVEGSAQNLRKKPRIKTTLKAMEALKGLNLSLVSLATNHYYDNLEEGFDATVKKLDELGIAHLGAGRSQEIADRPHILEAKGWRIGFLNYVHSDTNPMIPENAKVYASEFDLDRIKEAIRTLGTKVDRVILLLHWGGKCDYGYLPHEEQVIQAKHMLDAGADAIIGHHTHTFQARMSYKGKPVFFSLGNFCFADIECDGSVYRIRESGRKGGIVELRSSSTENYKTRIHPFRIVGTDLIPDPALNRLFKKWQWLFILTRTIPGMYGLYYYMLRRWEPADFHAQLNNTSMMGIVLRKLKRILGIK